jgi:pimeloyl-ACP methyl ester carboxylesterase
VSHTIATPDGLELRVEQAGAGERALLAPLACWTWPAVAPLADQFRVIGYDPRGRGGSSPVDMSTPFGLDADVADLEALRAALGLDRISLLGWSYYAAVTAHYAAAHPERVARLVHIGPIPIRRVPWFGRGAQAVSERVNAAAMAELQASAKAGVPARDPGGFCRAWVEAILPAYARRPDALLALGTDPCRWANEHPLQLTALLTRLWDALGEWDWRPGLAALEVPLLVLHGSDDFQPREAAAEWAERPAARLELVEGAGHLTWVDRPADVSRLVRAHLS